MAVKLSIEITQGITELTARATVKALFEQFGEVATCWLPPRGTRAAEHEKAFIKFTTTYAAERALEACNAKSLQNDGILVQAKWRDGNSARVDSREFESRGSNLISARDLYKMAASKAGEKKGRSRSRSRSTDRKKKTSWRERKRDDSKSGAGSDSESTASRKRQKKEKEKGRAAGPTEQEPAATKDREVSIEDPVDDEGGANEGDSFPLLAAAESGTLKGVMLLLKAKAWVNQATLAGVSPLHVAAKRGSPEICAALLLNRADVNLGATDGYSPLHHAACSGSLELVKALLHVKALVNAQHKEGSTPLHLASAAAGRRTGAICAALTEAGASVNMQDNQCRTPYDIVKEKEAKDNDKLEKAKAEEARRHSQRVRRMKTMKSLEESAAEAKQERLAALDKKRQRQKVRQVTRAAAGDDVVEDDSEECVAAAGPEAEVIPVRGPKGASLHVVELED